MKKSTFKSIACHSPCIDTPPIPPPRGKAMSLTSEKYKQNKQTKQKTRLAVGKGDLEHRKPFVMH
jgi:hypothetical protein